MYMRVNTVGVGTFGMGVLTAESSKQKTNSRKFK